MKKEIKGRIDSLNEVDYLYHLGLDSSMDLKSVFGDVKYVCMGGSAHRAYHFACKLNDLFGVFKSDNQIKPIGKTERCELYKVGPVISMSHGMGMPSMLIFLHEVTKLLVHAGVNDVVFIRIGTSGGIGVEPGTVVITSEGINGSLLNQFDQVVLGEKVSYGTQLNEELCASLMKGLVDYPVLLAKTMGTDDFYEGQGRMDGALEPRYSQEDKYRFLNRAYAIGVRNIEMESTAFAAFCNRTGIPAAIVCTTLLDRLKGDQVTASEQQLKEYSLRAQDFVIQFLNNNVIKIE